MERWRVTESKTSSEVLRSKVEDMPLEVLEEVEGRPEADNWLSSLMSEDSYKVHDKIRVHR